MMSERNRERIFRLTNGRCAYCGKVLDFNKFHIDHVLAKSVGGKDKFNMLPSCPICNLSKSNLSLEQFRSKIENLTYIETGKIALIRNYWEIKPKKIKFYFEELF